MSRKTRDRQQRNKQYYRVIRPNGTQTVVSATQFFAHVAAGNLIRDKADSRLARARKRLNFKMDKATGELIFQASRKSATTAPPTTSTRPLFRRWLQSERTLTKQQAHRRMLVSLPRVHTEALCLY